MVFANATVATGFAPRASAGRGISRDAPRTAEPARANLANRKKASRLRFGGASAAAAAAAAASRAGARRRRIAVSKRAETFRSRFRFRFRVFVRGARGDVSRRGRGSGTSAGGGGNDERRVRMRGFFFRFGAKSTFRESRDWKDTWHRAFSRVSRSAAACQRGDDAEGRSSHLRKRRGVRPPRLRLGVERGDRTLAGVHRDAASPGRARQLERARAGRDARREGQRAHERHRLWRARGNLEASECERFAELEGCLEEGGVGTRARGRARHETRGSRAVGGAVGGRGRQWRGARPRARNAIFSKKTALFVFQQATRHFFPTGGSHDSRAHKRSPQLFCARSVVLFRGC